jgi:hypothetical protein
MNDNQYRAVLVYITRYPKENKEEQEELINYWNKEFKKYLRKKAAQELVQEMSSHDSSNAEDSSTRPADDTTSSVRVWHVLKKKITGS